MYSRFCIEYCCVVREKYTPSLTFVPKNKSKHNIKLPIHMDNPSLVQRLKEKIYVAQKYHSERLVNDFNDIVKYNSKKPDTKKHLDDRRKMRRCKHNISD